MCLWRSANSLIGYASLSEKRQIRTCPAVDSHEKVQTYQHCGGKTLTVPSVDNYTRSRQARLGCGAHIGPDLTLAPSALRSKLMQQIRKERQQGHGISPETERVFYSNKSPSLSYFLHSGGSTMKRIQEKRRGSEHRSHGPCAHVHRSALGMWRRLEELFCPELEEAT
ncbi:hypothetical protein KOW79_012297 [Hemibagrus wyckioides]|uniref:Uncharacterized protein n=1 Tax=Hemibagrus wyckioides TaxID=337641 RepID=A0A9D3NIQ2_9TELE|nr:hypothetical protein KOW79_012297 [Hemibagrus wyckioides]